MKKKLRDLKIGDKIIGSDGKPHVILDLTTIKKPTRMFNVIFSNGSVKCSPEHQWTYWTNGVSFTVDTLALFEDLAYYRDTECYFGRLEDNIRILDVQEIDPEDTMCVVTDTDDGLFKIYTDLGNSIFTHNCGWRAFCGRATEAGASLVALDNTLATTIDNRKPGAGIVQPAGISTFVRYYFSKFEDLDEYYRLRGLDHLGYDPKSSDSELVLETLDGMEDLGATHETLTFEFENERTDIDKREDQRFEEI